LATQSWSDGRSNVGDDEPVPDGASWTRAAHSMAETSLGSWALSGGPLANGSAGPPGMPRSMNESDPPGTFGWPAAPGLVSLPGGCSFLGSSFLGSGWSGCGFGSG